MGIVAIASLLADSSFNKLSLWLRQSAFQFLGEISYSLYLIHGAVGWLELSIGDSLADRDRIRALIWLLAVVGASFLAA